MMNVLLASGEEELGGSFQGFGLYGLAGVKETANTALVVFNTLISNVIGVMTIIAGLWFIFNFIIGAYGYLSAGGNEEGVKKATAKIGQSLTGLVVVIAAYAIISIIGAVLGFDILNPQKIIINLKP